MSRIGKKPIDIKDLSDIKWSITKENKIKLTIIGKLGKLEKIFLPLINLKITDNLLYVLQEDISRLGNAYFGLARVLINNMIIGVLTGYSHILTAEGIGFKFQKLEKTLILTMGFTHSIELIIPDLIEIIIDSPTKIILKSIDKELLTTFIAKIRAIKPPEPYKGKGIYLNNEKIKRKAGKTNKK